ncbi:uncharacterized protein LOC121764213 [Salvia splendens]|uniref:uncharacterized protein LOC121764213 n=1 Tax=Salvia splendens TaxID=180675 RepID=UPI001C277ABE|nr:uncharacterized protein LOC121764213 [Salvia splendens]
MTILLTQLEVLARLWREKIMCKLTHFKETRAFQRASRLAAKPTRRKGHMHFPLQPWRLQRDKAKGNSQRAPPPTLSVIQLIELAMRSFTHSDSKTGKDFHHSAVIYPNRATFSRSKSEDIRLVQDLLSCAQAVSNHNNDCASEFLKEFSKLSSGSTNVMQRLVYYFSESLCDRILPVNTRPLELIPPISDTASLIEKLPFNQVMQFAGVQTMLDHISSSWPLWRPQTCCFNASFNY